MNPMRYLRFLGRALQLTALAALPGAIWVTEVIRSESAALTLFFGSITSFFVGFLLTRLASRG